MTSLELIGYIAVGAAAFILLAGAMYWSVNFFTRQLAESTRERFRVYLAQEVETAMGVFREKMCEQIVLQGKKSDSLAGLYALLIDLLRKGREFSASCIKGDPLQIEKGLRSINETCTSFFELFQKESLHFPEEFCALLTRFQAVHAEAMQRIEKELYRKDSGANEKEIRANWLRFEDQIGAVMEVVRKEFHRCNQAPGNLLLKGLKEMPLPEFASVTDNDSAADAPTFELKSLW
jgi:hypothetical protein